MTQRPRAQFLDRTTPPHLATLILMAGVAAMNMSIFLPSLNDMARDFNTSYAVMQLSVSGYLAMTALVNIAAGPISDRFGRRPVVMTALVIFALASLGCLLAPNAGVFLLFRMMQAAVASCLVLSRAIVRDMVPQNQAASMIGYVTMGMALVPMFGPMVGGGLAELFGWQAGFVFLVVAAGLMVALCYADQGETVSGQGLGFAEQLRHYPQLLRSQRFWGYVLAAACGSGAFFALLGGASYVSDTIYGLPPARAGVALGAPAVGYLAGNWISARFSVRFGIDPMILWGSVITFLALGASLGAGAMGLAGPWVFFGFCSVMGLGNGLVMPNAMAGMLSVNPRLAGTASGLGGAIQIGGGAALAALAGTALSGGNTPMPLQAIMFGSSVVGLLAIFWVMHRQRLHN